MYYKLISELIPATIYSLTLIIELNSKPSLFG
jgi:hypothetical protein